MLPWPLMIIIANMTGRPWRLRVCRKLRDIIPFPKIANNVVDFVDNLPFHPTRIIKLNSCFIEARDVASVFAPPEFIIVWKYDPSGEAAAIIHMGAGICVGGEYNKYLVLNEIGNFFTKFYNKN
jgi:hypothetical protein